MGNDKIADKVSWTKNLNLFIKTYYPIVVLIVAGYLVITIVNFFSTATGQTVSSFKVEDFELGQISDRTVIATKTIDADSSFPISIEKGERIIRKGFPITSEALTKLRKISESPMYLDYRAFANTQLYLLILATIWVLFFAVIPKAAVNKSGHRWDIREYIFQVVCFVISYTIVSFGSKASFFHDHFALCIIIPATLFVLIESLLYGTINAVFFSIIISLGIFNASNYLIVPFLYALAVSLFASVIVTRIKRRIDMVYIATLVVLVNCITLLVLAIIFNAQITAMALTIGGVAASGFLSGVMALGFITPIEFLLNTASVFRLMDLSDQNCPIMRKLLIMASGTYQHSLMVAQLAENACQDIGANALLARVGAYYHDIGKMEQSEYFTENQTDGVNKHDTMNPSLSVSIIRSHVKKGVEKARQLHLPSQVIDIIEEHHGNGVIAFFYNKAKALDPNVNIADYSYMGNPPSTKESGIIMLADTVEAACRSLDNPTEKTLDDFTTKLVRGKIDGHQLDNCSLTFKDITRARQAFMRILVGYYHNRIKYPGQQGSSVPLASKPQDTKDAPSAPPPSQKQERPAQEAKK